MKRAHQFDNQIITKSSKQKLQRNRTPVNYKRILIASLQWPRWQDQRIEENW